MSENESDKRQELSDDDLDEVSGGLTATKNRILTCMGCGSVIQLSKGELFPEKCSHCESELFEAEKRRGDNLR